MKTNWPEFVVDVVLIGVLLYLMTLMPACVNLGAADWRPEQHVAVMRTCKIVCHPGGVRGYDSTVGECLCYKPQQRTE